MVKTFKDAYNAQRAAKVANAMECLAEAQARYRQERETAAAGAAQLHSCTLACRQFRCSSCCFVFARICCPMTCTNEVANVAPVGALS